MKQDARKKVETSADNAVFDAARTLAGAVGVSEPFQEFEAALNAFQSDDKARELLSDYRKAERKAQMEMSWGGLSQGTEKKLSGLKQETLTNPVISRYFASQEALVGELKELNAYITKKIGFDFADMVKPAGGCC
jgi:cell fate (sporulation/competence/biofilm development) regulator YlbF (YheA/YmcA/DUF963 family)